MHLEQAESIKQHLPQTRRQQLGPILYTSREVAHQLMRMHITTNGAPLEPGDRVRPCRKEAGRVHVPEI